MFNLDKTREKWREENQMFLFSWTMADTVVIIIVVSSPRWSLNEILRHFHPSVQYSEDWVLKTVEMPFHDCLKQPFSIQSEPS